MNKRNAGTLATACALVLLLAACSESQQSGAASVKPSVEHGRYIAKIAHCGGCHNADAPGVPPKPENYLAGRAIGFSMPDGGIVYARNLTPDPSSGIGKWSPEDIITAFRTGVRPDGRILQVMPWRDYGLMNDYDAMSLALYLKSMPPSQHRVPDPTTIENATASYGLIVNPDEGRKILSDRALSHRRD